MPHKTTASRSRRRVMEVLKQNGSLDARGLSRRLRVSAMAVRQHLYALQEEQLVTYDEQPRPVGRPVKMWRLTEAANRYFPDAHAELAVDLIDSLSAVFGSQGIDKLIRERARQQVADYRERVPSRASLRRRLERLAEIRSQEGYMAEVQQCEDGSLLLIENHCPICTAAAACTGLCSAELDVFRKVLGRNVTIERTEHVLQGARRCAYRVSRRKR